MIEKSNQIQITFKLISKRYPKGEATFSRAEFGMEKPQFSKNNHDSTNSVDPLIFRALNLRDSGYRNFIKISEKRENLSTDCTPQSTAFT